MVRRKKTGNRAIGGTFEDRNLWTSRDSSKRGKKRVRKKKPAGESPDGHQIQPAIGNHGPKLPPSPQGNQGNQQGGKQMKRKEKRKQVTGPRAAATPVRAGATAVNRKTRIKRKKKSK